MNNTSFSRFIIRASFIAATVALPATVSAQIPTVSSLRNAPNEIERDDARTQAIIDRAEQFFKQGQLNLADNKREQARSDFDKAVDTILESGVDVRSNPRLQVYYTQLVERIYRIEVPTQQTQATNVRVAQNGGQTQQTQQPQIGFTEQKFEPSPLDELAKLELTKDETTVTAEEVAQLNEAKNSINFKFQPNSLIQQYINYYQGRGRSTMETGLRRSGQFIAMARKIFREEGVPEDIVWLGQVESSWRPPARSRVGATGLWQFMPGTGERFGLRRTAWIDERNSLKQATRASARYLKWLADRYNGNWELAMAAYNTGEGNIDRAIARAGVADFWAIYPYIAQETRNYVPNILATILIAKNPQQYGFGHVKPEPPLTFDEVSVPTATSLQLVAAATDTSVDYLRMLNPELLRDVTPRGGAYVLRVPPGRGRQFVALLKRVPPEMRENARFLQIAPGETWEQVSARTGMSVAQLQQWNKGVELKSGGKIVVPANNVRLAGMAYNRRGGGAEGSSLQKVTARAGETIAQIASRFSADAAEVARINNTAADAPLEAGRIITVPVSQAAPQRSSRPARRRR